MWESIRQNEANQSLDGVVGGDICTLPLVLATKIFIRRGHGKKSNKT